MAEQVFPTKGNLIKTKRSLLQAKQGFELMDRKRNVLIREMVALTDKSKLIRGNIEQTYEKAYSALQKANITLGSVSTLTQFVPEENGIEISFRSVMGVELPTVVLEDKPVIPQYDIAMTNSYLDIAFLCFNETKRLTAVLAEINIFGKLSDFCDFNCSCLIIVIIGVDDCTDKGFKCRRGRNPAAA